ncbi:TPA: small toxic polypeptide LdrA/LdrC [Escherichia coli]|nr:small toxic polypeptide LdrA/LdrC [Escherichia coli]
MTLAQFAMTFWHDLAAPILAGIITAAIVGWWRNRNALFIANISGMK